MISWDLPIRTVSEANCSEHWRTKRERHWMQQFLIRHAFANATQEFRLPCRVKMIRVGPRFLDADDNLRMAFKWIKDEISVCLIPGKRTYYIDKRGKTCEIKGRADDDNRISWQYDQHKSKLKGIRIEITSTDELIE